MLTNADIEKLKIIFATKQDLRDLEEKIERKLATKRDLQNMVDTIINTMTELISPLIEKDSKNEFEIGHIKTHLRSI